MDLKRGLAVKKHCSNGTIKGRVLILNAAETKFGWKKNAKDGEMVPLASITGVRRATEIDPTTIGGVKRPSGMAGTETLRKTADGPGVALRAFSLIGPDRTYDFECVTEADAKMLASAFKKLVAEAKA